MVISERCIIDLLKRTSLPSKALVAETNENDLIRLEGLQGEDRFIFSVIRDAGNRGIWTRHIRSRCALSQYIVNRSLKTLEQKQLIKQVKNVKVPTRKFYMLYELTPHEDVSGGPWYTDNELDTEFIEKLSVIILQFVKSRTFPRGSNDVIYATSYTRYPTLEDIQASIRRSHVITVDLSVEDIKLVVEVLVYDHKIEECYLSEDILGRKLEYPEVRYKATRERTLIKKENVMGGELARLGLVGSLGLTMLGVEGAHTRTQGIVEVPCGTCPIRRQCERETAINPVSCTYLDDWLK